MMDQTTGDKFKMNQIKKRLEERGHSKPEIGLKNIQMQNDIALPLGLSDELRDALLEARDSFLNSAADAWAGMDDSDPYNKGYIDDMKLQYPMLKQKAERFVQRAHNPGEDVLRFLNDFEKFNDWAGRTFGFSGNFADPYSGVSPELLTMLRSAAQAVGFSSSYY